MLEVHHLEWLLSSASALDRCRRRLVSHFGFYEMAERIVENAGHQVVVKAGNTVFILTHVHNKSNFKEHMNDPNKGFPSFAHLAETSKTRNTVFNVCFATHDLSTMIGSFRTLLMKPTKIGSSSMVVAAVNSCVGNIVHTLIDISNYHDHFLPGFELIEFGKRPRLTRAMDHITFVVEQGRSQDVLSWYKEHFGLKRFLVNAKEDFTDGVTIGGDVQMRLMAGEWLRSWLCAEQGLQLSNNNNNVKLVLAEPLDQNSHVATFLQEHGGPGIQHVGLLADHILHSVKIMRQKGARFRIPPPTYYDLPEKRREIEEALGDVDEFAELGLLVDAEADANIDNDEDDGNDGYYGDKEEEHYLLQIFSTPLFEPEDTFFLEVLERRGANGFGAGNISALAKAIMLYKQNNLT